MLHSGIKRYMLADLMKLFEQSARTIYHHLEEM